MLIFAIGVLLPAAHRLQADEADCAVVPAGTAIDAATGSVLTIGQAVIGQALGAGGSAHVGALYCLRSSGLGSAPGDCDNDGDVDLDDSAVFVDCLSGPGGGLGVGCECSDADADNDVDLLDFAEHQVGFTG
jgi:hypothetical protein